MQKSWNKIILLIICFSIGINISSAQNAQSDRQKIFATTMNQISNQNSKKVEFGFGGLKKANPLNWLLGFPMFIYQKLISPEFSAQCLYEPSCSAYSKQLISRYGIFKGTFLSADRLTRCNRLGAHDFESFQINPHTHKVDESTDIYK